MPAQSSQRYIYRLNGSDRISYVSPEWVAFAKDNDAPELTEEYVLGKPIWDFITGVETQLLYQALYRDLRKRRTEVIVPFRCDSPGMIRQMTLLMRTNPDGGIECEGRLDHAQSRESVTVLYRWAERADKEIPICSLCRRLYVQGEWVEVREAVVRGRLFNDSPVPRLAETVCPACHRQ